MVLGSGFHGVLQSLESHTELPYSKLPGFPKLLVKGHVGRIVFARLAGVDVVVLAGRAHFYEGYSMDQVTFGVRLLAGLGVESLLLTNAAGGVNPRFKVGELMLLTDHINFMGVNPLRGQAETTDSRFVDLTETYDRQLQAMIGRAARQTGIRLQRGVYLAVSGPSYETPAEIKAFRRWGVDAVGMSTVPEAIVARQMGLRVAGLSCITNLAAGVGSGHLSHTEVLEAGVQASQQAARLLRQFTKLYAQS